MSESGQTTEMNLFALTLLRDRLLPELLQDDESEIIYWAGKALARDVDLTGVMALETFFMDAGFGFLTLTSKKPTEQVWRLDGPVVSARFDENNHASFALEAGFLAQQTQQQLGTGAEAQWEANKQTVVITVMTENPGTLQP
ncbi:DUF2507 domain-containing protein [Weissella cibaria]|jgi:Protein of unknown function (DUF2507).|uniref:DUF2507 domain-containing protein n=1 Tax=Weissella cibaria TaxID=137591 RepID=A0A0D1M9W7_9LACO|nr:MULTISPECIES: DUF2507 domain-containing protein [Weissella]ALI33439.1 hypothetical protein AO080_08330 [Weissella cibaria]APS27579.1 hypothetical protein AUC63_01581 [Weissella cibaria]APU62977.1 hypothetical protein AUC65_01187 [Weissella cibaria]APU65128.1 hypothetical protein AUC62_01180 [Weissella cibaria]ASS51495.1 hypothetical protein CHR48_00503 [Weissella cibaria]